MLDIRSKCGTVRIELPTNPGEDALYECVDCPFQSTLWEARFCSPFGDEFALHVEKHTQFGGVEFNKRDLHRMSKILQDDLPLFEE